MLLTMSPILIIYLVFPTSLDILLASHQFSVAHFQILLCVLVRVIWLNYEALEIINLGPPLP
jgi:hypothetical protein